MTTPSNQHHVPDRRIYAFMGFLLGCGAPLGWLVWRSLFSQPAWLKNELTQFGEFYAYTAIGTITAFVLFGYFLGRRSDNVVDESETVKNALDKVNEMAMTDALTGIRNARYLHDHLSLEMESAKRYEKPLTCLMLDIDDFKRINDTYGHPYGDIVLTTLAKTVLQCVRRVDTVGRLGGEEFLVVMPHTSSETAFVIAERIRQAVRHRPFAVHEAKIPVTISIGVACYPAPEITDKSGLLKAADNALYQAKRTGKNRTIVAKQTRLSPAVAIQ